MITETYKIDRDALDRAAMCLNEVAKLIAPGPPIDEVAGPGPFDDEPIADEPPAGDVIEAGSTEIQYRFARECIGIATVELNRAYAEFKLDNNAIEIPTRRLQVAYERLREAMKYLDIDGDSLPF